MFNTQKQRKKSSQSLIFVSEGFSLSQTKIKMKNPFRIGLILIIAPMALLMVQFSIKTEESVAVEKQLRSTLSLFVSGKELTDETKKIFEKTHISVEQNEKKLFKKPYRTFLAKGLTPQTCMRTATNYAQNAPGESYLIFINGVAFTALSSERRQQLGIEYNHKRKSGTKDLPSYWVFESITENKLADTCSKLRNDVEFYQAANSSPN